MNRADYGWIGFILIAASFATFLVLGESSPTTVALGAVGGGLLAHAAAWR